MPAGWANGRLHPADGGRCVRCGDRSSLQCIEESLRSRAGVQYQHEPSCIGQQALDTGRRRRLLQTSIDHLRFALGGEANNADAYANLARAYFDEGQLRSLRELVCEEAILQGMDDAVLHNRLGLINSGAGRGHRGVRRSSSEAVRSGSELCMEAHTEHRRDGAERSATTRPRVDVVRARCVEAAPGRSWSARL